MFIYFVGLYAASLLFGYVHALNSATLTLGRSISDTDTGTGFQDAITPPWSNNLAFFSYAVFVGVVGYGWYEFGWLFGIAITVGFFLIAGVNLLLLPKSDSAHFRRLIVHSMMNRYANFVKSGDEIRASAMGTLLEKMGVPVPDFRSWSASNENDA